MTAQEYAFTVLAVIGAIAAIAVVTARNVVHAALYLVVTLASVGGVYLVLSAEFVAWVQILIYVGAIVILFLFGLMLTKAPIGRDALDNEHQWVPMMVSGGVFAGLVFLIDRAFHLDSRARFAAFPAPTARVGDSLFRGFVLPFEAVSFLLLAALIGAVVLARKDEAK
ncbi:MAG: NADH-quinone oxidoreductase subunit J [Actinobacteria bacterium]|nr:NADH-quinone oxidoreductase subunit J [Actinomycetota bacterium]